MAPSLSLGLPLFLLLAVLTPGLLAATTGHWCDFNSTEVQVQNVSVTKNVTSNMTCDAANTLKQNQDLKLEIVEQYPDGVYCLTTMETTSVEQQNITVPVVSTECCLGYSGTDCDQFECAPHNLCNMGTCIGPNICDCTGCGYIGEFCDIPLCWLGCAKGGSCTSPQVCTCPPGYTGNNCAFPTNMTNPIYPTYIAPASGSYAWCNVFGDGYYETFDGHFYRYPGVDRYILCKDDASSYQFARYTISWHVHLSEVQVQMDAKVITLNRLGAFVDGELVTSQAMRVNDIYCRYEGHCLNSFNEIVLIINPDDGADQLEITYVKESVSAAASAYIRVPETLHNNVKGMCGNYDGDISNDCTTSAGYNTSDIAEFGNSWANPNPSETTTPVESSDCESRCVSIDANMGNLIETTCAFLSETQLPFTQCFSTVDYQSYVDMCKEELCACMSQTNASSTCIARACEGMCRH